MDKRTTPRDPQLSTPWPARNRAPAALSGTAPRRAPRMAVINHGMSYSMRWPVRRLDPSGAFVEMVAGTLTHGAEVEVVVRLHARGGLVEHRLPATVFRIEADGVEFLFGHYDNQAYTDLVNLSA